MDLVAEQSSFELVRDGKEQTLAFAEDYIMGGNARDTDSSVDAGGAFVGFGVTTPEFQYDDYAGVDVRGKVAVILRGEVFFREARSAGSVHESWPAER